jgi:peptidoglycan/xylan/chitin deacetylase (PgdA/CDA1 family)
MIRRRIKNLLGGGLLRSGLFRRLYGDYGTIVAFHRVDDRYPQNPISIKETKFRAVCLFLRDHFQVVSLARFLDDLEAGRSIREKLVITLDDGYRDNYHRAAPVLSDLGLPATFFVTTGFIGTDRVPWWDRDAGIQSEWMSWPQVEELHSAGFEIGAHTVNHIDLGEADEELARVELEQSRATLQERLSTDIDLFAFPYGRAHQLSDQNRAVVRDVGFRCALSCHGGRVRPGEDPYTLRRVPVSGRILGPNHLAEELVRS